MPAVKLVPAIFHLQSSLSTRLFAPAVLLILKLTLQGQPEQQISTGKEKDQPTQILFPSEFPVQQSLQLEMLEASMIRTKLNTVWLSLMIAELTQLFRILPF